MKIKFCGAAEGVTGSCHLITVGDGHPLKILLDCGQFQGGSSIQAQNYDNFPFDPLEIDFMILTHAHIDHCGRLPLLVKRGFRGRVYCTDATADLLGVMLRDSAYIHEKEAEWKNRKAERSGRPATEPLYTIRDAEAALDYVTPVLYDQLIEPMPGVKFVMNDAGHIIGSAIIELWAIENGMPAKLVFTGDLGAYDRPMLKDPTVIKKADVVIMESTYGSRARTEDADSILQLADIIIKTVKKGGSVIIPAFAVGRTQELIYELNEFYERNPSYLEQLKNVEVYIDSPMATAATAVFRKNTQVFDETFKTKVLEGDDPLDFVALHFTKSTDESKALNADDTPKIIIAASGMCEAGRIRHHLKHHLWRHNAAIVFVGYQAVGSLGRRLVEGEKKIFLFGEEISVHAKIYNLEGFSAHADQTGLVSWASGLQSRPGAFFLVHGELESKQTLSELIGKTTGIFPTVVEGISEYDIPLGASLPARRGAIEPLPRQGAVGVDGAGAAGALTIADKAGGAGKAGGSVKAGKADGAAVGGALSKTVKADRAGEAGDSGDAEARILQAVAESVDVQAMRNRMVTLRAAMEDVLYRGQLAAAEGGDPAVLTELTGRLASLEKDLMGLAATLAEFSEKRQ